jgi:hypothetical protein
MRKSFRFTLIFIALLGIFLGWVFYTRWSDKQALIRRLEEQKESREGKLPDVYGHGKLTIMNFYSAPPVIRPGETALLCYSVVSADSVRIEPPVGDVWPSISRCVEIAPKKDTVYKLIASDAEGNTLTAETTVKVMEK